MDKRGMPSRVKVIHVEDGTAVGGSSGGSPCAFVDRVVCGLEAGSPVRGKVASGAAAGCNCAVAGVVPICSLHKNTSIYIPNQRWDAQLRKVAAALLGLLCQHKRGRRLLYCEAGRP